MADCKLWFRLGWPAFDCQGKHFQKQTPRGGLEGGRALVGDGEGALQADADAAEGAFLEAAADQGDAVGLAAGGRKFWERIFWIGGPVRARLGIFNEAGARRKRRVAGVVADGELFIAQRRNEQQIHLREDAGHLLRYFAAEAVGLDEIDGGEEARLVEKSGPLVRGLDFELAHAVAQG